MEEYPLVFDYSTNSRLLGLADMAKGIETSRPARATYKQTLHVLEIMASVFMSAEKNAPVTLKTHFEREAPMDPTLPHGIL
jgi:hypothetical protein